jgi:NAD(P)H dehydrogenase (quinone)
MILVTAAYGNQGKLLIPKLSAAGFQIRAARETPGKDDELLALGADEVFIGDLSDPDTYATALDGVDAVYHVGPGGRLKEPAMGAALLEAARKTGVRHVVYSSVLHPLVDIIQHKYKLEIEERLIESRLQYTILRPAAFMLPDIYINPVLHSGVFPSYWDTKIPRRSSMIHLDDLTDVATKVLREGETHYYAGYELAGTDKLTQNGIARILSRVLGRHIPAVQVTADDLITNIFGHAEPSEDTRHQEAVVRSIVRWESANEFIGNPSVLTMLLGRPPKTFEQFAREVCAKVPKTG